MEHDVLQTLPPRQSPFRSFTWAEAMGFAFGELGLSPDAFWQMTPREFLAALEWCRGNAALPATSRDIFETLYKRYPDQPEMRPET